MTTQNELKPCPFCGGDAEYHDMSDNMQRHWCGCNNQNCPSYEDLFETAEDAIKAWNTRPAPSNEAVGFFEDILQAFEVDVKYYQTQIATIRAALQPQPVDKIAEAAKRVREYEYDAGKYPVLAPATQPVVSGSLAQPSTFKTVATEVRYDTGATLPQPVEAMGVNRIIDWASWVCADGMHGGYSREETAIASAIMFAASDTPQAHIDVEALKVDEQDLIDGGSTISYAQNWCAGWNDCVDHIAPLIRGQDGVLKLSYVNDYSVETLLHEIKRLQENAMFSAPIWQAIFKYALNPEKYATPPAQEND